MLVPNHNAVPLVLIFGVIVYSFAMGSPMAADDMDLLAPYETGEREFRKLEIGDKIVFFHQRMVGDAYVEKDFIVYQFDGESGELLARKVHWRNDVPQYMAPGITKEQAEAMVEGEVESSELWIISPESDIFPIEPAPENPCWIVRSNEDGNMAVSIIDAVTGQFLGHGVQPPP